MTPRDLLAAAEMQTRYRAAQQADRMDRIRADIKVRRFAEELRDWDGGGAA